MTLYKRLLHLLVLLLFLIAAAQVKAQQVNEDSLYIREHYFKKEYKIPMRDGKKLYTVVYSPKGDKNKKYPILINRTPYSAGPYGEAYKTSLGPSSSMMREGYIFVYQDVRGTYMSEGEFVNMTPHIENKKRRKKDIDESTDTYDTIDWLTKRLKNDNGKVGQWGISYPGFYAAAGLMSNHPALKAVSPQAPIADWFWDDFHHNGAFFLPHAFNFLASFGLPRPAPTSERNPRFDHGTPDGYDFFMRMGSLKNANTKYLKNKVAFWNEMAAHPNYDKFWQDRNLLPHLKNLQGTAVMTVGGWYDAEDLYGPLKIYREIEKNNPNLTNMLVMGPWVHGGWARTDGSTIGNVYFGQKNSPWYQENVEAKFFNHYLKEDTDTSVALPEAIMFEGGTNQWREFNVWPPQNVQEKNLYFHANGKLSFAAPQANEAESSEYISDPDKPVPFTEAVAVGMTREYMTDDQRFASRRPDVLAFQTDVLTEDITFAGEILAQLQVATTGTAADWVVKLIDVYPDDAPANPHQPEKLMGGYQQMVRSEVMRGRFRNSFETPEPFIPNKVTPVNMELQDVLYTFKKGHRIMVQVQSTWFPLVDRNPQKYVDNIFEANEKDFTKATHKVYHSFQYPTILKIKVL
ncbi:CocE/NonD family hydrolase [Pontibacter silvestris]|uniref:CocE/NonD family hydrolase n=1 Tax=Pontibacter silvestris TaxID=2305183 RepID=A0ABW4X3R8_9BACT|nr:CocE/NonD family hydrolase [Pontibacter silvestris]MCC9138317.1 CocE/NonD family hydrolase [Pontibacter silvestris]